MAVPPASLSDRVLDRVNKTLSGKADAKVRLKFVLRELGKWRSALIQNSVVKALGTAVVTGPFQGMKLPARAAEGCFVPKLLGSYESPLHPVIERIVAAPYERIVDIGCAEGYYAVGLALRMPKTRIFAFDINEKAQAACRNLAVLNGVADRVTVGGLFSGADFADYAGSCVVCDIEGAERALLDPAAYPGLREVDVLVEAHDCFSPGLSGLLRERFAATHRIESFESLPSAVPSLAIMETWDELDRLLAVWEWRSGPTPWLFMTRRPGA
jgi:SAM-dependent methyltransferase